MDLSALGDNYPYVNQYIDLAIKYAENRGLPKPIRLLDCGYMGCSFYTTDPEVVFKMTIDESETQLYQKLCAKPEDGFARCQHVAPSKETDTEEPPPDLIWREYVLPGTGPAFDEAWVDHNLRFAHNSIKDGLDFGETLDQAISTYEYHLENVIVSSEMDAWRPLVRGLLSLLDQGYVVDDINVNNAGMDAAGNVVVFDAQLLTMAQFLDD